MTKAHLRQVAMMVADPCGATLVDGVFGTGEGALTRLKSQKRIGDNIGDSYTCGYCLWCPDFTNKDTSGLLPNEPYPSQGNLFLWQSDDTAKVPSNTGSVPYGYGLGLETAEVLNDPAANLLRSDIIADARCIGACMQLRYFGKMMDAAGEIGYISNLPVGELISGGVGNNSFSVDELMNYANNTRRFGTDTVECVYRLDATSSAVFRKESVNLVDIPPNAVAVPTGPPSEVSAASEAAGPRMFGFVWRNTLPNAGCTLSFTKSIEYRSEVNSGITQTKPRSYGANLVPAVNKTLDRSEKSSPIFERTKSEAMGAASRISQAALSGVANYAIPKGVKILEDALIGGMTALML